MPSLNTKSNFFLKNRKPTTPEDDTIILNTILAGVLVESHAVHTLWKLSRGGNIGCFRATIVFATVRNRTKTQIVRLVFIRWFRISEGTSKI